MLRSHRIVDSALAVLTLGLMLIGGFEPFYYRIYSIDRARLGRMLLELPYSKTPGLREFLLGVRDRTSRGDRIAMCAPIPRWYSGYDYVHARASYLLAGREVVATIGPGDVRLDENLATVDFVASWHIGTPPGFTPIWGDQHGVLARKVE